MFLDPTNDINIKMKEKSFNKTAKHDPKIALIRQQASRGTTIYINIRGIHGDDSVATIRYRKRKAGKRFR